MRNYENIERLEAKGILNLFQWRRTRAIWANEARRAINRIRVSDEEVLIIAGNRIRTTEADSAPRRSWLVSEPKVLGAERDVWLDVSGQELHALMRLAGVREEEPVIEHHPYRVRYPFYRNLFAVASRDAESRGARDD